MAATNDTRPDSWHVGTWGPLGSLETAAKGAGILTAVAGAIAVGGSASVSVSGLGYGVVGLASVLALGSVVQLGLRFTQRELVSLGFAVANLVGHAALLRVVTTTPDLLWAPVGFGTAYVVGEVVKQRFLAQTGYTENGQSSAQMRRVSQAIAALHLLLALLAILR